MSLKLLMCKMGFHKWIYSQRKIHHNDKDYFKNTTHTIEVRKCIRCEKIEQSVFGYSWEGKFK